MSKWILSLIALLSIATTHANGRLTEFVTERLPVLVHNLYGLKIDLNVISMRAQLGPRSALHFKNGEFHQTAKGSQRVRLVQTYGGYEVYGPSAVAELNMEGHFTGHLYGAVARNLHKDIPNPDACVRDVDALLNRAIRLEKVDPIDPNIDKRGGRRVIYADPNRNKARIVYIVEFFYSGDNFVSLPVYFYDACSNTVIFSYNDVNNFTIPQRPILNNDKYDSFPRNYSSALRFNPEVLHSLLNAGVGCDPSATGKGGNKKTGRIYYNTPPYCLPVQQSLNRCIMEGNYFKIIDNKRSRDTSRGNAVNFRCKTGYLDSVNDAYGVANDAMFLGELTGRFFHAFFGQKALPYKPRIVVHFGVNYENAFWTGRDMFFGDGRDSFYPLVSLDIIAHELAHGFTRRHSDLLYRGPSGGINEAYSDISGVVTSAYIYGETNWEIGSDVMKSTRRALRYMNNPPKDGRSIKNILLYRPGMDVHHSSGLFNYAFYKMVDSRKGSMKDAYASFYIANKLLWGKLTRFRAGACNVMQASYDAGTNYRVVRRAFFSTGIPLMFCWKRGIWTTLFPGETRENILVSQSRSPILAIDMSHWLGTGVEASTDAHPNNIRIVIATDDDADCVIAKGNNYVEFPTNHSRLHVKLMSDHDYDIKVTLKVLS